jgi:RNA polymerase sigma-70 factor (ECF subfamily)
VKAGHSSLQRMHHGDPRPSVVTLEGLSVQLPPASATRTRELIVNRARAGDRDAFEALVAANLASTFRTALAILGSEADARDACQEVFLKAWRELPRLRDVARFDAWLGRILVNACRSALRTRRRRYVREIPVDDPSATRLRARVPSLDDRVSELDLLERSFERLSIAERTLLALHYLENRSIAEIAEVLGVPQGTVKSRLHAARRSFERALEVSSR